MAPNKGESPSKDRLMGGLPRVAKLMDCSNMPLSVSERLPVLGWMAAKLLPDTYIDGGKR